jgi:hypothetical protein
VTRQKITFRRACAFLGGLLGFALDHLRQGASESISSPSSSLLDAALARGRVEGIKGLGLLMFGIGGIILYTFTSSCSNISIFIYAKT